MALPILYWMLECTGCGSRRVVRDSYLMFVGTSDPNPKPGDGYGGPPLPERYGCTNRCSARIRVVGSIFEPGDQTMWRHEPHEEIEMDQAQAEEWLRLIQDGSGKKWWQFWRRGQRTAEPVR